MNTKLISKTLISAALAASSLIMLSGTPAQAAPARQDVEEFNQAVALKEAGFTFPAMEEYSKVRREAIEAENAAKREAALANAKGNKAATMN